MTISSMTGFAALSGRAEGLEWDWEVRSVNARGLDLRMRLPEGLEMLEPQVRKAFQDRLVRGSVQIGLRARLAATIQGSEINDAALDAALENLAAVSARAQAAGLALRPVGAADLMAMRGVVEPVRFAPLLAEAADRITADLPALVTALQAARAEEGAALHAVLTAQVDAMATLVAQAAASAEARAARVGGTLRTRLAALLEGQDRIDEDRLAQELALLAVKADVTEEIDRLTAHVAGARTLLAEGAAAGRRLDFLMQEFNREANTLCAKSQDSDLTAIGLELKVVIDQMREQCQNVE